MTPYFELLRQLLPFGCYSDADDSEHAKDLSVHARALDLCQDNAEALFSECFPLSTSSLLPDWERVYGIAHDADMPYSARVDNLITAINARGSLTRDYFVGLATRLGYTITSEEFEPLMAGWAESGEELLIEDIVYVWQVTVSNSNAVAYCFEAGVSGAGDALLYWSDAFFEAILNRLKPAHTAVIFAYQ